MPYVVDVTGRGPSTASLARRGVVAFVVVLVAIALLLMQYRGVFRDVFPVTAVVTDVGDGVQPGADVKLRGMLVGSVGGVRVAPGTDDGSGVPKHAVDLELKPALAERIPAGVTARVVPTNIFGAPAVELLDPANGTATPLARGATIQGDESRQTLQLQTVMNRLHKVLRAVHPAQLNIALTNIAQSLNGRGEKIGSLITRLDRYVTTLNGHTDDFTADLRLLGTALDGLAEASPELLDAVDNAVVTSRTIVDERDQLAATLTGGASTADTVDGFLEDNSDRIIRLVDDGAGIAGVLAPQRRLIPDSLESLSLGARSLGTAFSRTGKLSLVFTLTPLTPYTAADCPRYPGLDGPNCGDPVPPAAAKIPGQELAERSPIAPPSELPPALPLPAGTDPTQAPPRDTQPAKPEADPKTADRFSLPGLFGPAQPSSFGDPAQPDMGGSVGPVGSPTEVRTISALIGGRDTGAAGALLLGPIARGATVVVRT